MTPDISHWRSSEHYDYVEDLVSPELAWEWLRRNEDYQRDFEAAQVEPNADTAATEATRSRWGLRFPVSPALDAKKAAPIWAPTSNTGVVMLTAQPAILPKDARPSVIDAEAAGQSDAQGFHFLHNLKNGERLQILRLAACAQTKARRPSSRSAPKIRSA